MKIKIVQILLFISTFNLGYIKVVENDNNVNIKTNIEETFQLAKSGNKLSYKQTSYNNEIIQKLNVKGVFPYLILYNYDRKEFATISGYNRIGVELFIKHPKEKMLNE